MQKQPKQQILLLPFSSYAGIYISTVQILKEVVINKTYREWQCRFAIINLTKLVHHLQSNTGENTKCVTKDSILFSVEAPVNNSLCTITLVFVHTLKNYTTCSMLCWLLWCIRKPPTKGEFGGDWDKLLLTDPVVDGIFTGALDTNNPEENKPFTITNPTINYPKEYITILRGTINT